MRCSSLFLSCLFYPCCESLSIVQFIYPFRQLKKKWQVKENLQHLEFFPLTSFSRSKLLPTGFLFFFFFFLTEHPSSLLPSSFFFSFLFFALLFPFSFPFHHLKRIDTICWVLKESQWRCVAIWDSKSLPLINWHLPHLRCMFRSLYLFSLIIILFYFFSRSLVFVHLFAVVFWGTLLSLLHHTRASSTCKISFTKQLESIE